jgi:hypothetical protein
VISAALLDFTKSALDTLAESSTAWAIGHSNFGIELGPAGRPDSINNNPLQLISHTRRPRTLAKKGAAVEIKLVRSAFEGEGPCFAREYEKPLAASFELLCAACCLVLVVWGFGFGRAGLWAHPRPGTLAGAGWRPHYMSRKKTWPGPALPQLPPPKSHAGVGGGWPRNPAYTLTQGAGREGGGGGPGPGGQLRPAQSCPARARQRPEVKGPASAPACQMPVHAGQGANSAGPARLGVPRKRHYQAIYSPCPRRQHPGGSLRTEEPQRPSRAGQCSVVSGLPDPEPPALGASNLDWSRRSGGGKSHWTNWVP